ARGSECGQGGEALVGGDLGARPRRRATERSEGALLAAPPELAVSPKRTPSPTACEDASTRKYIALRCDNRRVIPAGRFDRSFLGRVINVHDAKSLRVTQRSFGGM